MGTSLHSSVLFVGAIGTPRPTRSGGNKIIDSGIIVWLHAPCFVGQIDGPTARSSRGTGVQHALAFVFGQVFEMSRSRLQVFYVGNVQGVGFRYTVKALAAGFEVTGTVRNLPDGRVELAAEGSKDELSAFQQAIRESELGHFIRGEEVAWREPQGGFRGFEIVR